MATRLFLRQSQTEPTTGGSVYDLGTSADTGTLGVSATSTTLVEAGRWVRELTTLEQPGSGSISIPYQISVSSQSTNAESRIVVARLNSSGAIQGSFNGATYTGTGATTLSGTATLSGFVTGDLAAVIVEIRRTSGGGSRTITLNTTSNSFIDVPRIPAGQGENLSVTSTTGDATGEQPAIIPKGQGENLSVASTTGDATGGSPAVIPKGQGANLSVTSTAGDATGGQPPPPPPWSPDPTVRIDGIEYTQQTVGSVTVTRGRRTVYERPNAGYASIELRDVGDLPQQLTVGSVVEISVVDSTFSEVRIFTGLLSDWQAQTIATGGQPVVAYRLQAVGPLASLNRRRVATNGAPIETDGERVLGAILATGLRWEEAPAGTWNDQDGDWASFGSPDTSLIDPGLFDLAELDANDAGYNALQVAQDAGFSGEGILFETADGRLGYANADRRAANERAGFLRVLASQLDVRGLRIAQALAEITNRVTVEYAGGAVVRDDPFSLIEYGPYETSLRTELVNLSNATVRAEEFIARHSTPTRVLDELPFNLRGMNPALRDALLGVGPNAAVEVDDIPARLGITQFQGFVEGMTITVDEYAAELVLTVSDKVLSVGSQRWGQVPSNIAWQDVNATLEWQDAREVTV
jgi:hypothetical protein